VTYSILNELLACFLWVKGALLLLAIVASGSKLGTVIKRNSSLDVFLSRGEGRSRFTVSKPVEVEHRLNSSGPLEKIRL
jgi:hypothetical protein